MSAKILIVEDEPAIQELLAFNVTQAGFRAMRAEGAESAWLQIRQDLPDLILLDWMLPGTSGLLLAKQFRSDATTSNIPIIMLTARAEERDKILGLESGADDYITKPFSPRELMARIRAILRRSIHEMPNEHIDMDGLELSPVSHRVKANGVNIELGPTEFRLLHFFMSHADRVYSRSQLLSHVWGTQVFVEERTIDVHIRRQGSFDPDRARQRLPFFSVSTKPIISSCFCFVRSRCYQIASSDHLSPVTKLSSILNQFFTLAI
jgi:two-component system phosphate regulon response regulator PhoB